MKEKKKERMNEQEGEKKPPIFPSTLEIYFS